MVKDVFVQLCNKDNIKEDQVELNKNVIDDYLFKPSHITKNVYKDSLNISSRKSTQVNSSVVGSLDFKTQSLI